MTNKLEISRELLTILADLNCPYDQLIAAKQRAAEILAAPVVERQPAGESSDVLVEAETTIRKLIGFDFVPNELQTVNSCDLLSVYLAGRSSQWCLNKNYEGTDLLNEASDWIKANSFGGTDAVDLWERLDRASANTSQPSTAAVVPDKYDDVLIPFVAMMRKELHANAGKGDRPGWMEMSTDTALLEIIYHFGKLQASVKRGDEDGIREYAADVANMCMMLVDVCACLDKVKELNQ